MVKVNIPLARTNENTKTMRTKPDQYTQISFYINLAVSTYLLFSSLMMLVTLNTTKIIEQFKQISASELIDKRGAQLGFEQGEFQLALNQYYVFSIVALVLICLSLILLWKKWTFFYPLLIFSTFLGFLSMLVLLGPSYFLDDISWTEKVLWLVLILNSTIYWSLLKKEKQRDSISLIDED